MFGFQVLIDLSNTAQLDNIPRWLPLKEQSEGLHHGRSHTGQGRHGSSKPSSQHSSPKTTSSSHDQDSPKSSVIKSRSHGIFPDPAKGRTQLIPLISLTSSFFNNPLHLPAVYLFLTLAFSSLFSPFTLCFLPICYLPLLFCLSTSASVLEFLFLQSFPLLYQHLPLHIFAHPS